MFFNGRGTHCPGTDEIDYRTKKPRTTAKRRNKKIEKISVCRGFARPGKPTTERRKRNRQRRGWTTGEGYRFATGHPEILEFSILFDIYFVIQV